MARDLPAGSAPAAVAAIACHLIREGTCTVDSNEQFSEITERMKKVFHSPAFIAARKHSGQSEFWAFIGEIANSHTAEIITTGYLLSQGNPAATVPLIVSGVGTEIWKNRDLVQYFVPVLLAARRPDFLKEWRAWLKDNDPDFYAEVMA